MNYRDGITLEMEKLAQLDKTVFLGENIINSGRIYGTLDKVPINKCIEMPICENLIASCALGLALKGYYPICIFQRMDFMLIAADSIINHACAYELIMDKKIPIIFRTVKANLNEKFYVGVQHSKDLSYVFEPHMPVIQVGHNNGSQKYTTPERGYTCAKSLGKSVLVVDNYVDFNEEIKESE